MITRKKEKTSNVLIENKEEGWRDGSVVNYKLFKIRTRVKLPEPIADMTQLRVTPNPEGSGTSAIHGAPALTCTHPHTHTHIHTYNVLKIYKKM